MGDYSGYGAGPVDPYEAQRLAAEEEERKRREEEARLAALANPGAGIEMPAGLQPSGAETFPVSEGGPVKPPSDTVEQKHEVVTYADGSQTRKTTQEVPAKQQIPYYQQYLNEGAEAYGLKPVFGQAPAQAPATRTAINPETGERYQQLIPPSVTQESLDEMERKGRVLQGPSGPRPTGPGAPLTAADIARVSGLPSTGLPRASTAGTEQRQGPETASPYGKMPAPQIMAESGGNHIDPKTGQIITSPKGALGIAQVMPKTAMNPGFGIKDIFTLAKERGVPFNDRSEASAKELLANKDLNLAMGGEFRDGMLNYFGGDNEKATAAYNAGAGRVNQAVKQADATGGNWTDYLPTETQNYLKKTLGPVQPGRNQPGQTRSIAPPAEAQPFMGGQPGYDEAGTKIQPNGMPGGAPPAEAQPEAQPALVDPNAYTGQGLRAPGVTPPPPGQPSAATAIDRYQAVQDDPIGLFALRNDDTVPKAFRERAAGRLADFLQTEKTTTEVEKKVKEQIETGDTKGIAKDLAKKPMSQFDLIWQSTMMRLMGANAQADKLFDQAMGTGGKSVVETDDAGNKIQVDYDSQGKVTGGLRADGTELNATQAIAFASGGTKIAKPDVSMQAVEATIDGKVIKGRVVTTYDRNNKPKTQVESGSKYYDFDGRWKDTSIGAAAEKAETAAAVKFRYAGPTSYTEAGAKAAGEFNFNNGTNIGYQTQQPGAPLVDLNTGKPVQVGAGGVITTTQSGTPGAAPAQGGAPVTTAPAQVGGQTPVSITQGQAVSKVAQDQFVKTTVPAVIEQGNNGRDIATARRQQLSIIENNPSILDIYNGSGTQYDRGRNVISKLLTGVYNENNSGDFYKDVQATGLDSNQRSAIEQMWNLTQGINGKTLKTNTGGGPVSNADMKVNRDANLANFTETTPLGALQVINRSKFQGDLDAAKTAFIAANPQFNDDIKFNSEWAKESAKYTKAYEGIAEERAKFLKPFAPPKDATKEQLSAFRDKVFKSFEMYPVPTFDSAGAPGKQWSYGTANAERAAAKKLLGRK